MKRWTTDFFIKESRKKFGERFDYSCTFVVNGKKDVTLKCNECGNTFYANPRRHLLSVYGGCPVCKGGYISKTRTSTFEIFEKEAKKAHGDKYSYDKTSFVGMRGKVKILCPIHGWFEQNASNHVKGCGCPLCKNEKTREVRTLNKDVFIERARKVHGDKYDYSLVNYVSALTKVKIICPEHGVFEQTPSNHWRGEKCPYCSKCGFVDTDIFIKRARLIHNNYYDYSKVLYINTQEKVEIICPKHGSFFQRAKHHLSGKGCPMCCLSSGEKRIKSFLENNNIKYISEYKISNESLFCVNKALYVDFFLVDFNIIIEYNGKQHYSPIEIFGGQEKFKHQQERDYAVKMYCKEHGIKLIEIPYNEFDNIENILEKELNIHKSKT